VASGEWPPSRYSYFTAAKEPQMTFGLETGWTTQFARPVRQYTYRPIPVRRYPYLFTDVTDGHRN
jgi:hypothetical protein